MIFGGVNKKTFDKKGQKQCGDHRFQAFLPCLIAANPSLPVVGKIKLNLNYSYSKQLLH